ncbi:MAG: GDSL-type esterase/lipase family protein [Cytophagales bacterium]
MRFKNLIFFIYLCFCVFIHKAFSQESLVLPPTQEVLIQNVKHLYPLFDSLYSLQKSQAKTVNILHIGDSHIQGNYMTDKIRNNFYSEFGISGRGLSFPYKLVKIGSPSELKTTSNYRFNSWRCIQPNYQSKVGILGVSLLNYYKYTQFKLNIPQEYEPFNYNTVKIMYTPINKGVRAVIKDGSAHNLPKIYSKQEKGYVVEVFKSPQTQNELQVSFTSPSKYARCVLHGLHLSNTSQGGICYNVAGINSSQYRHWSSSNLVTEQSKHLRPHLIIISLGTNDANDTSLNDSLFIYYVDKLVSNFKVNNPKAKFLLMAPPDSYYRKLYPNMRVGQISQLLSNYCNQKNIAFWNLQTAMGGTGSIKNWFELNVAASDLIHYSKTGYEIHGELFYQAFIKQYKEYVAHKYR